jgi:hypothetical protein
MPHPISLRSILILSTHLNLRLPSGVFPPGFPINKLYAFPAYLILLNLIILIILGDECKLQSSPLCSFLHPPIASSLHGSNILLSTFYTNTLSLFSSLNVRDQISRPYIITGKIIVLCIFTFLDSRREDNMVWMKW